MTPEDGFAAQRLARGSSTHRARAAAREAAFALRRRLPHLSASRRDPRMAAAIAGPAAFVGGAIALAPQATLSLLWAAAALALLGVAALRAAAALTAPVYSPRRPLTRTRLPSLSVLCPIDDEPEDVVAALAASLARMDYPRDRLEVVFVVEETDPGTLAAALAAAAPYGFGVVAVPDIGPRTKPKALNAALARTSGRLVAVYDAEDAPAPDQLRAAAEAFAADEALGCVQAPLGWYNADETWITGQFALEYAAQFHVMLPFYRRIGWPPPLGGTSNVFRRAALDACGGWDPFNVTEDADIGFRLARFGWRIGLIEPGTLEEAPLGVAPWLAQRSRWLKGHLITTLVHLRDAAGLMRAAGPGALASLLGTLGANAASAALHAPSLALCLTLVVLTGAGAPDPPAQAGLAVLFAGYACAALAAHVGLKRAGLASRPFMLLTMPLYWPLQSLALARALRELAAHPYSWAKTRHGLSRMTRTRRS